MSLKDRIPGWGQVLAWLGIISTILGIIGFFIADLPAILGKDETAEGLTEEQIVATMSALNEGKREAELELTRIALEDASVANQQTQEALQGTIQAARATEESFVATQNAIAAATATQGAVNLAATSAAATEQAAATATANFLANTTPTPTSTPTLTPLPTLTPTPVPVTDWRALSTGGISLRNDGTMEFSLRAEESIPDQPQEGLSYVWSLDTDLNPETGAVINDIGIDRRIRVQFSDGGWVGTVRALQADGTLSETPFTFASDQITINGPNLSVVLRTAEFGFPAAFNWVARAELDGQNYSVFPSEGHVAFGQ